MKLRVSRLTIIAMAGLLLVGPKVEVFAQQPRTVTMEEAVSEALTSHPLLNASQAQVTAASAKIDAARSGKGLRVTTTGGYVQYDEEPSFSVKNFPGATSIIFGDRSNPAAGVVAEYPLYTGGRVEAATRQARAGRDAAEAGVSLTRDQVAFGVRSAYMNVLRAREAVTVREAALTSTREHLRVATELREAEIRPKIDVVRAEVQVREAEELLERARNQVAVAEAALAQAMGLNPSQNAVTPSQNILPSPTLPETPDAAQERAISQRAELVQLRADEQAAAAGVDAAASGLRPTVGLSAELTAERFTTMPETGDWSVMIGARWPISDAGETRARKREAQAQRDAVSAQFEQIRNGVALEVQQAWLDLQSARRRENVAVVAVDQARESVRLAEEGYAAEVYPLSDLLDARAQLTAAEVRLVDARYEVRQAQERLLLAMGESAR